MILWGMRAFGTRFLPKKNCQNKYKQKTEKETAVRRLFLYLTKNVKTVFLIFCCLKNFESKHKNKDKKC